MDQIGPIRVFGAKSSEFNSLFDYSIQRSSRGKQKHFAAVRACCREENFENEPNFFLLVRSFSKNSETYSHTIAKPNNHKNTGWLRPPGGGGGCPQQEKRYEFT